MNPRPFAIAAVVALLGVSAIARAESTPSIGYVDLQKAIGATADGKSAVAKVNAVAVAHQPEVDAAKTQAKKDELVQKYRAEAQRQIDAETAPLWSRAQRLLAKIAAEHHLTGGIASAANMLYVPAKLDYTAELTKRLDAGDGKTDEEAQAELMRKNQEQAAEIAQLRAKVAEAKKPDPSPPPAPPVAPPAPKTASAQTARPTVAKK